MDDARRAKGIDPVASYGRCRPWPVVVAEISIDRAVFPFPEQSSGFRGQADDSLGFFVGGTVHGQDPVAFHGDP